MNKFLQCKPLNIRFKQIPDKRLKPLIDKLVLFPVRSIENERVIKKYAIYNSVSVKKVYCSLARIQRYSLVITNLKMLSEERGEFLSTHDAINLLEDGYKTLEGIIQSPKGLLKENTVDLFIALIHRFFEL